MGIALYLIFVVGALIALFVIGTRINLDLDEFFARKVLGKKAVSRKHIFKGTIYQNLYGLTLVAIGAFLVYVVRVPFSRLEIPAIILLLFGILYFGLKYMY